MDSGKKNTKPIRKLVPNLLIKTTIVVALGTAGNIITLYSISEKGSQLLIFEIFFLIIFAILGFASLQNALDDMRQGNYFFPVCSLFAWLGFFITVYAQIYKEFGLIDGSHPVTRISDFLYFSIITWTTVGYGDIKSTVACRLFTASEALLSYIFMGIFIAVFFSALNSYADFLKTSFYKSHASEEE